MIKIVKIIVCQMDPLPNHPNPSPFQVTFPAKDRLGRLVSGSMSLYYNKVKYIYCYGGFGNCRRK